jgi:hypothetical protein
MNEKNILLTVHWNDDISPAKLEQLRIVFSSNSVDQLFVCLFTNLEFGRHLGLFWRQFLADATWSLILKIPLQFNVNIFCKHSNNKLN